MKLKLLFFSLATLCLGNVYAQPLAYTKDERRVLKMHGEEWKSHVQIICEDAYASVVLKYHVERTDCAHLARLINDRESRKYAHNYLDSIPVERVREKMRIDSVFQDSIDALLIPNNHQISGKAISLALQLADHFNVSKKKQHFLMDKALSYARMKRKNPNAWFAKDEIAVLGKVFTRKQVEIILDEKNRYEAEVLASKIWDELAKAGLTEELDSTAQMYLTQKYFTLDKRYRDLFVGDDETLHNNLDGLYKSRPKMIKMHEALETRKRVEQKNKEQKKKVSDAFAW